MIARVAIDSEALLDFKEEPRRAANVQADLVEVLHEYGYVEQLGENDRRALYDAIGRLSPGLKELWTHALKDLSTLNRVRLGDGEAAMRDLCAAEELPACLKDRLDLVVIRESLAAMRGVPLETGHVKRDSEPEISLSDSVRRSSTVQGLSDQRRNNTFAKGQEREPVWWDLLAHAAALSTGATVLDRFFLTHLLTKTPLLDHPLPRPKGKSGRDHHEWLLRKLDQSMQPGASVRVISELPKFGKGHDGSSPPRMSSADAEKKIEAGLARLVGTGRISELHIVLAPWPSRWLDGPHNRHIRFSCGAALCTYEGFDYLDEPALVAPFTWQAASSAQRIGELSTSEKVILRAKNRVEVKLPMQVVAVGDEVTVEVLDVDMDRERVSLSLKATQEDPWQRFARTHQMGQVVPGKVTKLVPFGAFVRVEEGIVGLVHISELAERPVEIPEQVVTVNDDIFVKVIRIDLERRRISLSLRQANEGGTAG